MTTQTWNASTYATNARFVAELGAPLLELLRPQPAEDILDLGCGDGVLSLRIAEQGAHVVSVDASSSMVEAALAAGVDAYVMNGEELQFENAFDAVFSNAALHWMKRPDKVLAGVAKSLRSGGRFVAEFGGHGNVASISVALRAVLEAAQPGKPHELPWYFPTAEEYADKLARHGFVVDELMLIPRPTLLPTGMEGWLQTFAQPTLAVLPPQQVPAAQSAAIELLRPVLCDGQGRWIADYVRLRVAARKK